MRRLFLILAAVLLLSSGASAAVCPDIIIPKPVGYEVFEGEYILKGDGSDIRVHSADRNFLRELKALSLKDFAYNEAYRLMVGKRGVDIYCTGVLGEYRARQSLSYMASFSDTLSFCSIVDYPRFAHRGIMLDISRNFRDKDFILRQIDVLDMLKMNSLHLHLADDAGWRVEISSYPRLTGYAAWRKGKEWTEWRSSGKHYAEQGSPEATGGFLTKEEVAEIVSYARKKNINIIPEIEMPGHSAELLAAYPEVACLSADGKEKVFSSDVCPGNVETFRILEGILDEIIELFPSTYIDIG
ncbi:MAG: family 20 glycosylhydrolase, partial [Bacteroidales bacterium]|nr:family 20 glycosylhydrolase [Bacteroidales bacterium]